MQGRRRVKTDAIDLEAISELVLAGHGVAVTARAAAVIELTGWAMHRGRRVQARTAVKNQLLGQLDRCFPGLTAVVPDVWASRWAVWSPPSSPTRIGWSPSGLLDLSGSPPTAGCGFGGR